MFIQKENFIIKCESIDEKIINSISFPEIYRKVADFFEFKGKTEIHIYFMYSLNEFNFFYNRKHEKWICAFAKPGNLIFVFSPEVIEEFTTHKKDEIPQLITHELSHILYEHSGFREGLSLLNEGIATYLSFYDRQIAKKNVNKINLQKIDLSKSGPEVYDEGFKAVNKIISSYGKEGLFSFLRSARDLKSQKEVTDSFKAYFKQ